MQQTRQTFNRLALQVMLWNQAKKEEPFDYSLQN
jgi:hypothetical protein